MYGIGTEISPSTGRQNVVIRVNGVIAAIFPNPEDGPVEISGLVARPGVDFHVKSDGNDDNTGLSFDAGLATWTKAISLTEAGRGDRIFGRPGLYAEAEIDVSKTDLELVGLGPRGAVVIKPASGVEAMKITADDVSLYNLNLEGDSASDYALSVGKTDKDVQRFRAYGCKLEVGSGSGAIVLLHGPGDVRFIDNVIAWGGKGFEFRGNLTGFPTQIYLIGNHFHNITADHLVKTTGNGKVVNLNHVGNTHDNLEAGTEPTGSFITLDVAESTGVISDNRFATATNSNSKFVIASGLMWVANKTEAGVSTARPA